VTYEDRHVLEITHRARKLLVPVAGVRVLCRGLSRLLLKRGSSDPAPSPGLVPLEIRPVRLLRVRTQRDRTVPLRALLPVVDVVV
jgi:hypothetical protein